MSYSARFQMDGPAVTTVMSLVPECHNHSACHGRSRVTQCRDCTAETRGLGPPVPGAGRGAGAVGFSRARLGPY